MKPEWIHSSLWLWLLIFSMLFHTLSGGIFSENLSEELCDSGHLGVRKDLCNYPPVRGHCKSNLFRFYYNTLTFNCEPFIFSGCGSNRNNFKHKYLCEKFCLPKKDRQGGGESRK
ncbi:early lactation protein-like [Octodon degus]|uniref:Early lactation protein-like n=1 Tax=Octodon degus TaxID=10160 RepID=A0A6P6EWF6_OCTDE|nr:early lactation protein-like [Octodon degus]